MGTVAEHTPSAPGTEPQRSGLPILIGRARALAPR